MFTGIVQEIVTVTAVQASAASWQVTITRPTQSTYALGDSILLDGICSTVTALTHTGLTVVYMPQTLRLTTAAAWQQGQHLNCEAPLTLQTKLSGALVLGHVDTAATIQTLTHTPEQAVLTVDFFQSLPPYIVSQGGVTLNGVNLTIVDYHERTLTVHLIPQTWQTTTWSDSQPGDQVNVEFDYIAKVLWFQQHQQTVV